MNVSASPSPSTSPHGASKNKRIIAGPIQCPVSGSFIEDLEEFIVANILGQALLTGDTLTAINQGIGTSKASWSPYMDGASIQADQQQRCQRHQASGMVSGSLRLASLRDDPIHTVDEETYRDVEHIILSLRLFSPSFHSHDDIDDAWSGECTLPSPTPEAFSSFEHPYWDNVHQALSPLINKLWQSLQIHSPLLELSSTSLSSLIQQHHTHAAEIPPNPNTPTANDDLLLTLIQAQTHQNQGQYSLSAQSYERIYQHLQSSPSLKDHAQQRAAQNYALADTPEKAVPLWEALIQTNPSHPQAALNLALHYEQQQLLTDATRLFQQHQQAHPQDLRTFFGLARIYSKQEDWQNALSQYKQQLTLSPQDAWCLSNLATCELQLGHEEQAIDYLKQAQALDPQGEAGQYAQLILMQFEGPLI